MGVTGLLPHLKEIQEASSLEKYRGKTLAVDTYGWLHRGLISCAQELCQDKPTKKYVTYVMNRVKMLKHFGVEPYLVFDGANLPTKADTAKERREKREEARKKADNFVKRGDRKLAWKEFMKAAGVSHEMAKSIMVELDLHKVKYIVAPYEADPQMVYLEKIGAVDGILSEDSDLLIFGCRRLITKLNDQAECYEINRDNFARVKKIPSLAQYTPAQLRLVAMLSGCDYTKGIANIGIKTAFNLVKKYNNFDRVLIALRSDGKKIEPDFEDEVHKANLAFQFQKVFDPFHQKLTTLNEYPDDLDFDFELLESCCGKSFDNEIHVQICNGKLNPNTHDLLLAREQSLATLKGNSVYGIPSTKATTATKTKSLTNNGINVKKTGIDSFFNTKANTQPLTSPKRTQTNSSKRSLAHRLHSDPTVERLSPTSKKIKKYTETVDQSSSGGSSKFFKPRNNVPTPDITIKNRTETFFDSSAISGDSDIPDEFSSPVKNVRAIGEIVDTRNVLKELEQEGSITDNDEIDDSLKNDAKISNHNKEDFDLSDENEEIEESPVKKKTATKLSLFATTLRERFLMKNT
ncbi:PIN domain-like protein, partial [Hyphopichia burtonii NRRL Y-1933]